MFFGLKALRYIEKNATVIMFFQLFYTFIRLSIDKIGRILWCPFFVNRQGVLLIKFEQFQLLTCLGHSNVDFILYVWYVLNKNRNLTVFIFLSFLGF